MVLFLPSPSGIATGEAEAVGVSYIPATEKNPPLRVFYPAALTKNVKEVGFFQDTSPDLFLQGYWGLVMGRRRDTLLYKLGMTFFCLVAWVLPFSYIKVPGVYQDPPSISSGTTTTITPSKKLPLIVFSHGDRGTGQENSILLSAWAKQGYVVVSVHHTDGSSNHVRLADGNILWNDPGPPLKDYDANFRPKQIEKRVDNILMAREWLASNNNKIGEVMYNRINWDETIVAGFSYGAATTALLAAKGILPSLKAVILLDGWFYVDVRQSGVEYEFPKEAFDGAASSHLQNIPAILINCEAFTTRAPKLWAATKKIASKFKDADPPHVIANSTHINFCDLIFWFPPFVLSMVKAPIDTTDPKQAYQEILNLTVDFLKKQQCLGE